MQRVAVGAQHRLSAAACPRDEPLSTISMPNLRCRLRDDRRHSQQTGHHRALRPNDQAEGGRDSGHRIGVMRRRQAHEIRHTDEIYNRPANSSSPISPGATNELPGTIIARNGKSARSIVGDGDAAEEALPAKARYRNGRGGGCGENIADRPAGDANAFTRA